MSLLDVDVDAPRRIEAITADGLRALGEVRQRADDIDKAVDEMFEQRERARQELEEQVRQATNDTSEAKPDEEERPKPKRTLALGGEEFQQAREAKQAEPPKPAGPPPVAPSPEPEPRTEAPHQNQTLKLGARADGDEEQQKPNRVLRPEAADQPEERPVRRPRPPRPEGEDDMSGRTWLR